MLFAYESLIGMPPTYFHAMAICGNDTVNFLNGACIGAGVPNPNPMRDDGGHPPGGLVTTWLGCFGANEGINLTEQTLHCFTLALQISPASLQHAFLCGVFHANHLEPPSPVPLTEWPETGDGKLTTSVSVPTTGNGNVKGVTLDNYVWTGTVGDDDPKQEYGRGNDTGEGDITWFYTSDDLLSKHMEDVRPNQIYISNHKQRMFEKPTDAKLSDRLPAGFVDIDNRIIFPFPSASDSTERWTQRTNDLINTLLCRGNRTNTDLHKELTTIKLSELRPKRGTCGLCRLPRTLSYTISFKSDRRQLRIGSDCAAYLFTAIQLALLPKGSDPSHVVKQSLIRL